jgi:hypothetical protein
MALLPFSARNDARDTVHALFAAYKARAAREPMHDWRRDHLGASLIGHKCDRFLWLSFRWATNPKHSGKQLRLFERGNREEEWIIEDLRAAGLTIQDADPKTGTQRRVSFGGHVGGSIDGLALGVHASPRRWHLLEIKSHNRKNFEKLVMDGVKRSKPEHYAQMLVYLLGVGLEAALYVAVCKDSDDIYMEIVPIDRAKAVDLVDRAKRIAMSAVAPAKSDMEYPPCRYTSADGQTWLCQHYELCHGTKIPERNCRTCIHAMPQDGGGWLCSHHSRVIDSDEQREGCPRYFPIPKMINAQIVDGSTSAEAVFQFADGTTVTIGGGG